MLYLTRKERRTTWFMRIVTASGYVKKIILVNGFLVKTLQTLENTTKTDRQDGDGQGLDEFSTSRPFQLFTRNHTRLK